MEPDSYPGGGYLLIDSVGERPYVRNRQARRGCWYQFKERDLEVLGTSLEEIASGKQPIAVLECAMLPLTLLAEAEALAQREVVWFVDNTAALSGVVKGSSGHAILERLIGAFWMPPE